MICNSFLAQYGTKTESSPSRGKVLSPIKGFFIVFCDLKIFHNSGKI